MYILSFETTGNICSAALIDGEGHVIMEASEDRMSHLRELTAMSQKLVDRAGIKKSEISAVASSAGPGSFTGIRIGVTTARTVAQALSVKCISVSSLKIFDRYADENRSVAVIFNARRGQVYGAVFGHKKEEILAPGPYMLEDVLAACEGIEDVVFFSDRLEGYKLAEEKIRYQTADMVAEAAKRKYEAGETLDYEELLPDYMRAPEAEQKLKSGQLASERAAKLAKFRSR